MARAAATPGRCTLMATASPVEVAVLPHAPGEEVGQGGADELAEVLVVRVVPGRRGVVAGVREDVLDVDHLVKAEGAVGPAALESLRSGRLGLPML